MPAHILAQLKGACSLSWVSALRRFVFLAVFCNVALGLFRGRSSGWVWASDALRRPQIGGTTTTMLKLSSALRSRKVLAAALGVALIGGGTVVVAQTAPLEPIQWDRRRLEQLDRNVRRLERAVTQRNAAGQPVLVEPDPEVVALQGRVGIMDRRLSDLEATVQRVNADIERLTFALDEATRDNAALGTRLRDAEGNGTPAVCHGEMPGGMKFAYLSAADVCAKAVQD